jgi:hypothetical protein
MMDLPTTHLPVSTTLFMETMRRPKPLLLLGFFHSVQLIADVTYFL